MLHIKFEIAHDGYNTFLSLRYRNGLRNNILKDIIHTIHPHILKPILNNILFHVIFSLIYNLFTGYKFFYCILLYISNFLTFKLFNHYRKIKVSPPNIHFNFIHRIHLRHLQNLLPYTPKRRPNVYNNYEYHMALSP